MGRGRRVEIPAKPMDNHLQAMLALEVYDDFPNIVLTSVEYKNAGPENIRIDRVISQSHRFSSHAKKLAPYDMWSFQGSSYDWGKDYIFRLKAGFSQPNEMGAIVKGGYGGGIPVVAFWTASVGEAIGHLETIPLTLSLPVRSRKTRR